MNRFSVTAEDQAVVGADRDTVWRALRDPETVVRLTPLLHRIDADDHHWRWHLAGVSVLGLRLDPSFTERMRFEPGELIDFSHAPPAGHAEHVGVDGSYRLSDCEGGTHLAIRLAVHADLPLARATGPAVRRGIGVVMAHIGGRFSENLLRHVGAASDG